MPRGVYTRKKKASKTRAPHGVFSGPKVAKKKAVKKTRRPRGRVVETDDMPTISRSALKSSVSPTRAPPAAHALVTRVEPQSPFDGVLDEQDFALINEDGDLEEAGFDTFDAALAAAREYANDKVENDERDAHVDIYQRVARVEGTVPENVKAVITVKAVAGSPV